ncbi:MAG: response regulator transcription factor [Deltaproteobacteria bacterium]|nr:response regulator transcription factor [Deltaproteobacteria bacterium]
MAPGKTILVIEDEPAMVLGLTDALAFEGYRAVAATTGRQGVALARSEVPDLVLLDLMLPDTNGFEVCALLRQQSRTVPIIILSARGQESDKIRGLDAGADDYVTKPFSVGELVARVRALLRRAERALELDAVRIGDAEVSLEARTVTLDGRQEDLSSYEVELLRLFLGRVGQAVSRDEILTRVWGVQAINSRAVDNFIVKLRKKIERTPDRPQHILTVYGHGYKLVP